MQLVSAGEELDARHLRHPLVGDQEGNWLRAIRQCRQLSKPGRGPVCADDASVVPEAAAEIGLERFENRGLGRDEED